MYNYNNALLLNEVSNKYPHQLIYPGNFIRCHFLRIELHVLVLWKPVDIDIASKILTIILLIRKMTLFAYNAMVTYRTIPQSSRDAIESK